MKTLSDLRGPVSFTTDRPWNPASAMLRAAEHWQEHARKQPCRSRLGDRGATPLSAFRFLTRQSAAGWRLCCMRCVTGAVGCSSEPQIRRGRPSFFACMQATKHCQSRICPSKIWRRGQASCDEPVQFRSRRGDPLCMALFGIHNVPRHSTTVDALLTKLPGKGGELDIMFWQVE